MKRFALLALVSAVLLVGCGREGTRSEPTEPELRDVIAKAQAIVTAIAEGRYEDARKDFDANMRQRLPASRLSVAWTQYRQQFGEFQAQGDHEVVYSAGFKVVNIALDMAKMPGQARISFDDEHRVAGLFFLKTGVPVP